MNGLKQTFTYHDKVWLTLKLSEATTTLKEKENIIMDAKALSYKYENNGDMILMGNRKIQYLRDRVSKHLNELLLDGSQKIQFDNAGRVKSNNLISKVGWYNYNQPACLKSKSGAIKRYSYKPDGSRFAEVLQKGGNKRSIAYVNQYVQYHRESKKIEKFYYVDGVPIGLDRGEGKVEYYVKDHIKTNRIVVDGKGDVSSHITTYPFGGSVKEVDKGKEDHRYRFAGYLFDNSFGMYQLKARYYDPGIGRFVSPDFYFLKKPDLCVESPIECNLYSYARNNPLKYTDPTGMFVDDQGKTHIGPVSPHTNPYGAAGNEYQNMDAFNKGLPGTQYATYNSQNTLVNQLATDLPFDAVVGGASLGGKALYSLAKTGMQKATSAVASNVGESIGLGLQMGRTFAPKAFSKIDTAIGYVLGNPEKVATVGAYVAEGALSGGIGKSDYPSLGSHSSFKNMVTEFVSKNIGGLLSDLFSSTTSGN